MVRNAAAIALPRVLDQAFPAVIVPPLVDTLAALLKNDPALPPTPLPPHRLLSSSSARASVRLSP